MNIKRGANLIGMTFGRLIVIDIEIPKIFPSGRSVRRFKCKCSCGSIKVVMVGDLKSGKTQSCGCLTKENSKRMFTTHGMTNSRIYEIWCGMWKRCTNKNNHAYGRYGGRGIFVDPEWRTFEKFLNDMGSSYRDDLTIERKDVNGPYSKENCCWATYEEQGNNTRTNRILSHDGKSMTVAQWSRFLGWPSQMLYTRLHTGWTIERALTTPPVPPGKYDRRHP